MKDVTFLNWTFKRIEILFFIIRGFLDIFKLLVWHIVVLILILNCRRRLLDTRLSPFLQCSVQLQ